MHCDGPFLQGDSRGCVSPVGQLEQCVGIFIWEGEQPQSVVRISRLGRQVGVHISDIINIFSCHSQHDRHAVCNDKAILFQSRNLSYLLAFASSCMQVLCPWLAHARTHRTQRTQRITVHGDITHKRLSEWMPSHAHHSTRHHHLFVGDEPFLPQ